jgi:hypothetical protein
MWRPGPPSWELGTGLTIQPHKKVIVEKPQRGGQGPIWAVETYDDDGDDDKCLIGYDIVSYSIKMGDLTLVIQYYCHKNT